MRTLKFISTAIALIASVQFTHQAMAQAFPGQKPVRLVVPFAAGSGTDAVGRILAQGLSQAIGQKVLVENIVGAGGAIGLDAVAKSAPDGYVIGMASTSTYVYTAALEEKKPYSILVDFVPFAVPNDLPLLLASTAQIAPRNFRDLIGYLKINQTPFVSAGVGTGSHVMGAALIQAAGGKGDAVHYKGTALGIPDLIAGRVNFTVDSPGSLGGLIKEGKLVGLAVFGSRRVPIVAEVPTMGEAWPEAPQYMKEAASHILLLPAKTPRDVVTKLNADLHRATADASIREGLEKFGAVARAPMNVEQVSAFLRQQVEAWSRVVTTTGIKDALKATAN